MRNGIGGNGCSFKKDDGSIEEDGKVKDNRIKSSFLKK